jgi:hypothetical protein
MVRYSMVKMRFGAVPVVTVKIPQSVQLVAGVLSVRWSP